MDTHRVSVFVSSDDFLSFLIPQPARREREKTQKEMGHNGPRDFYYIYFFSLSPFLTPLRFLHHHHLHLTSHFISFHIISYINGPRLSFLWRAQHTNSFHIRHSHTAQHTHTRTAMYFDSSSRSSFSGTSIRM